MKIIPFLMVYSGLLVYQGLQSTHEFFFSLFLSPYSRQFPDLHHFLHKKIFNFNLRNVIWQVFAIIIILKYVFQLKLKNRNGNSIIIVLKYFDKFLQYACACVKLKETETGLPYCTVCEEIKKLVKRQWSFWFWRSAF